MSAEIEAELQELEALNDGLVLHCAGSGGATRGLSLAPLEFQQVSAEHRAKPPSTHSRHACSKRAFHRRICATSLASTPTRKAPFPGPLSVERTGIEPVTSGLQSRRSPS
jgi:hypothetical protein